MPNQVEPRTLERTHFWGLALEFLHVVFAEIAQPEFISLKNHRGGKDLRYRQKEYPRWVSTRALCRTRDALANLIEPLV